MKKKFLSFAALWLILAYGSQVYAAIVVGGSYNTGNELRPIMVESFNSGATWSFPSVISQVASLSPSFAKNGRLSQTTCNGTTCIGVGSYEDGTGVITPLISVSRDGGKTWRYAQIGPSLRKFADYTDALLFSVSCRTNLICMAVGTYQYINPATGEKTIPQALIATTKDGGKNWTFKTLGKGLLLIRVFTYNNNWFISGTSMIGDASGGNTEKQAPLYKSSNDGSSWTIPSPLVIKPSAIITDLKCSGKFCLGVGGSLILDIQKKNVSYTPFLVVSNNGGTTWTMPNVIRSTKIQGILVSASCSATNCMAVGLSGNPLTGSIVRPLAYVTQDSGVNWSVSNIYANAPASIKSLLFAGMSGVACKGAVCFATGIAVKLNILNAQLQLTPFLVVSKNWGKTWSYNMTVAANNKNGYIFNPTFNGNVAMFLGGKLNTTTMKNIDMNKQTPFIGVSSNNGASWTYPAQVQKPTVSPAYSTFGGFDFISNFSNN